MKHEIDPKDTIRAQAFKLWIKSPMPMVTLTKTFDVTRLCRVSHRRGIKFNMLLCWCIGKTASRIDEFYLLPEQGKLMKYDRLAHFLSIPPRADGWRTCRPILRRTAKDNQHDINKQDFMTLRPFNINDAPTILSWCKDKHAFRLWSADRYKDYPAKPEEMMEQYNSNNMYPLTAVVDNLIIGHILLRYPSEDKTVIRFGFVIVDDSKRGKGYGKQMLRLAIDHAKHKLGVQKITLGVFDNNPSAIHCYESVGFVVTGIDTYAIDGEEWTGKEMELVIKNNLYR